MKWNQKTCAFHRGGLCRLQGCQDEVSELTDRRSVLSENLAGIPSF